LSEPFSKQLPVLGNVDDAPRQNHSTGDECQLVPRTPTRNLNLQIWGPPEQFGEQNVADLEPRNSMLSPGGNACLRPTPRWRHPQRATSV